MKAQARHVGVRELRNALSAHLRRVEAGATIVVTARGREVARLVPAAWPAGLVEMARRGEVTLPDRPRRRALRPAPYRAGEPLLSDIIIADRHR